MASIDLESQQRVITPLAHAESPININRTIFHSLGSFPKGYPRLARFLDSDDAFMVYRRFGTAFSRVLLQKQDEISELEMTLLGMDKWDENDGNTHYLSSRLHDAERESIPSPWQETRSDLIEKLRKKLLDYAQTLLLARQLKALDRPSDRDYRSILNFMEDHGGQLFEESMRFIYEKEDLVTLRPGRAAAWLVFRVGDILRRSKVFNYLFCSRETEMKSSDPNIRYYDHNKISAFVTMLVLLMVLTLLVGPAWLLWAIGTMSSKLNTVLLAILSFTLVFSATLAAMTKAKGHEILAASVGYCCVLLIFVSNMNNIDR